MPGGAPKAFSAAFSEGVESLIGRLGGSEPPRRADAIKRLTSLVGAAIAARAVGSLREEILAACGEENPFPLCDRAS